MVKVVVIVDVIRNSFRKKIFGFYQDFFIKFP